MGAIFSLGGQALLTRNGNERPFLTVKSFEIKKPGVYTLEGPNGCGKSMFIRFLTGTLPGAIEQNFGASLSLDGHTAKIFSYRDAVNCGIVSVFQDDDLISSMTVFENIVLRHGSSSFKKGGHYLWDIFFNLVNPPLTSFVRALGPVLSPRFHSVLERLEPPKIDWKNRHELREQAALLLKQHGVPIRILDEMPARLSGGGRAAAKLICAQLHKKTKVLLLDEAFNGVERNIWPRFVDGIKAWAQEKGAVVVAITHSSDELLRWDPLARFDIRDGLFVVDDEFLEGVRRRATSPRQLSSPVFELAAEYPDSHANLYFSLWKLLCSNLPSGTEVFVIVDAKSKDASIVKALKRFCPLGYIFREHLELTDDDLKSLDSVIGRIESLRPKRRAVFVVAGGPVLRVLSSIGLQITQHLAAAAVVVAPVSFDDAVRAVVSHSIMTSIPGTVPGTSSITLSSAFSPDAFILPLDSLERLSSDERKLSLVPCVRLGILFDQELFRVCEEAFSKAYLEAKETLAVFRRAVSVVNEIAELGPNSPGIGRITRFGDSHAAMIERLTGGRVSNGQSLILGMLLELVVSNSDKVFESLKRLANLLNISFPEELGEHANWQTIESFYNNGYTDTLQGKKTVTNLAMRDLSQFSVLHFRENLASAAGKQNLNLAKFANDQAEGELHQKSLEEIGLGIRRLEFGFHSSADHGGSLAVGI